MARPRSRRPTAWRIGLGGTIAERLELATDPGSDAEALAAVAPRADTTEAGALDLILEILRHPNCLSGLVGRYATCPHDVVRRVVAHHAAAPGTALDVLAHDVEPAVRRAALHRLANDGDTSVRAKATRALMEELG